MDFNPRQTKKTGCRTVFFACLLYTLLSLSLTRVFFLDGLSHVMLKSTNAGAQKEHNMTTAV